MLQKTVLFFLLKGIILRRSSLEAKQTNIKYKEANLNLTNAQFSEFALPFKDTTNWILGCAVFVFVLMYGLRLKLAYSSLSVT